MKRVLDACCGGRMIWFDKQHSDALFADIRNESVVYKWSARSRRGPKTLEVRPDVVADFTSLPFAAGQFRVVVFDPPHLLHAGPSGWQAKKYGRLGVGWQDLLRRGFAECFRVLAANGVLVFKWNETDIPVSKILALTDRLPLVGNRCGKANKTHWILFLK
jgi:SAM-dependent methyltransferase